MEKATLGLSLMLLGGPAAFLLGNGIFRRMLHPRFPPSHLYGLAVLALFALLSPWCNLLALSGGGLAALLVAIFASYRLMARA